MAENEDLTSDPAAGASPTGSGETDPTNGNGESPQSGSTNWEERYKGSSRELNRLRSEWDNERRMLQQQNWELQQKTAAPQPVVSRETEDNGQLLKREEASDYANAIIDGNADRIAHWEQIKADRIGARTKREVTAEFAQGNANAQKVQASIQYLASVKELSDPTSPVAKTALRKYQQMINDPSYAFVERIEIPIGKEKFNPHIMRLAVMEARSELGTSKNAAQGEALATMSSFSEPSGGAGGFPPANTFNAQKHLSDYERTNCGKIGLTPAQFWEKLKKSNPDLAAARLKQGKALSMAQLRTMA